MDAGVARDSFLSVDGWLDKVLKLKTRVLSINVFKLLVRQLM
jgi:hypothetical protein